jgi:hypothetical protein
MKLPLSLKPLLMKLNKIRGFVVVLAIITIVGYTAYQISIAVSVTTTEASIEDAKEMLNPAAVKFDMTTINSISRHTTINVSPDLNGLGTANPFYGQ